MKNFLLILFISILVPFTGFSQDCTQPVIAEVIGAGTYCLGDEVTLEIKGDRGDAEQWQWYTGSCGGDIIADADGLSITVTVDETTSYFVRGIGTSDGNCVGLSATCKEIKVVLDDIGWDISCPEDVTVQNDPGACGAIVSYDLPPVIDNCSVNPNITITPAEGNIATGSLFPVGTTTLGFSATDEQGNELSCSFDVTVEDDEISCPADIEVDNDEGDCGAIVEYDMPTAKDNCTLPGEINIELDNPDLASGKFFPVGTTEVFYAATDGNGNSSKCSFKITVNDVEAPVITLSKDKTNKWPPNHKPFTIEIGDYIESITDNCEVSMDDIIIDEVSSDEEQNANGDGNTDNDITIADDCKTVHLLAERKGGGNGRVYTINLAVPDIHGNIGYASIKAEIRHDNGKKGAAIDDGPLYVVNGFDLEEDGDDAETQPIEETSNAKTAEIKIETYPNPADKSLKVELIAQFDDKISIDLYTLSGKKIRNLFNGAVLEGKGYSWDFDIEYIRDRIFLLVVEGEKTRRLSKILKDQ